MTESRSASTSAAAANSERAARNGRPAYADSTAPSMAMSDPMPGATSSPLSIIDSMSATVPASGGATSGLTTARAAISGCRSASHTLSRPPMDSPTTTTESLRAASSA